MKKFLALLLCLLMVCTSLVIVSCEEDEDKPSAETTRTETTTEETAKAETTTEETTEATSVVPTGYQLYDDGELCFAYPKTWTKTVGSTVILQNTSTGNNITVVYEAKTDYYEKLTKSTFQSELKPVLESLGMSISDETVTQVQNDNGMKITEIVYLATAQGRMLKQTMLITTVGERTYSVTITEMQTDDTLNQNVFDSLAKSK